MSHSLIQFIPHLSQTQVDTLALPLIAGVISYVIRAFFKPTKMEARVISNVLAFITMALIKWIRYYHIRNNEVVSKYIDKIYTKVFHLHHNDKPKQKVIIG